MTWVQASIMPNCGSCGLPPMSTSMGRLRLRIPSIWPSSSAVYWPFRRRSKRISSRLSWTQAPSPSGAACSRMCCMPEPRAVAATVDRPGRIFRCAAGQREGSPEAGWHQITPEIDRPFIPRPFLAKDQGRLCGEDCEMTTHEHHYQDHVVGPAGRSAPGCYLCPGPAAAQGLAMDEVVVIHLAGPVTARLIVGWPKRSRATATAFLPSFSRGGGPAPGPGAGRRVRHRRRRRSLAHRPRTDRGLKGGGLRLHLLLTGGRRLMALMAVRPRCYTWIMATGLAPVHA